MNQALWISVNQDLVAKALSELSFEQVLDPREHQDGFELTLSKGVSYSFQGSRNIWGQVRVKATTLLRNREPVQRASQFFQDIQPETGMNDLILAQFLEEMNNTLYADANLAQLPLSSERLGLMDGEEQQLYLTGHPKIILNKGRLGWSTEDQARFAPESLCRFRLHWLAVRRTLVRATDNYEEFALAQLGSLEVDRLKPSQDFVLVPVHPWQWENVLEVSLFDEIMNQNIVHLGEAGDSYQPQTSLRTLTNVSRKNAPDIKLSLSILNTSCVRGLPPQAVLDGVDVSRALKLLIKSDPTLARVTVLEELAGLSLVNPQIESLSDAPYRFRETLGVVIRENPRAHLLEKEQHTLTASLFHVDRDNEPLIGTFIERSGLSAREWMRAYFSAVIVPLYHLQIQHGVGLVAHGQNIVLRLTNAVPSGIFIKDFQGDLRLSNSKSPKEFSGLADRLTKLPPEHLIHDLFTGHIITVLRFISPLLEEANLLTEKEFYGLLKNVLTDYESAHPVPASLSLRRPEIERILLNKVRFAIGYGDSSTRPLPQLGSPLKNPLGDLP